MSLTLTLIGIGTGNPDHLTRGAVAALNRADLILIPQKGAAKADLAAIRQAILDAVLTNPATAIATFDLPERDEAVPDYLARVDDWHDAIAARWAAAIAAHSGPKARVALLVWGDPSLYDSTLRIAARLTPPPQVEVIPGITALQALTAAHAIPLNGLGAPVTVTTGRRLRDHGWPEGATRLAVMLDGGLRLPGIATRWTDDLVGREPRPARTSTGPRAVGRGGPPDHRGPRRPARAARLGDGHLSACPRLTPPDNPAATR